MPTKRSRRASNRIASSRLRRKTRLHSAAQPVLAPLPAADRALIWRARRPKLLASALTLVLLLAMLAFFNSDSFYVFDLQVQGLEHVTKEEIERASGLAGYNIFFIEPVEAERAIRRLPEIKGARVIPSLPNQLVIDIVERKPELAWLRGEQTFWVDDDGIAFQARRNLPELTMLRDLDQTPVKAGIRVLPAAVGAVKAFKSAWSDAPRNLEWSAARGIAFTNERGWKIYLGDESEMNGKLAKLRALIPQLVALNTNIKFIDLGKGDPYYQ